MASPRATLTSRFGLMLWAVLLLPVLARAESKEACVSAYENAQLHRLHGQYVAAREALLVCVQPSCPNLLRGDCVNWLSEVDKSLPSLVFAVTDLRGNDLPDARVYANGKLLEGWENGRAQPFDPGVYTLRFEAPDREPAEQTLTVREAEKNRLVRARLAAAGETEVAAPTTGVTSDPLANDAAEASALPLTVYFLGGTSLVSLGAFTYFAASGKKEYNHLEDSCSPHCDESDTKEGRRDYVIADVTLGLAIGTGAAALWVWLAHRNRPKSSASLSLNVGPTHARVGWTGRF
jgi:hypothetical protein